MTHEDEDDIVLRMVESKVLHIQMKIDDVQMSGSSVGDYAPDNVDPSGFVNAN